jgi:hypothetical protein
MSLRRTEKSIFKLVGLIALPIIVFCLMPTACQAFEITIDVSPNVLNIQSNSTVLTVHTNIDFDLVNCPTVAIYLGADATDPVPISWWKEDDRGNFVAKFSMNNIKAELGPEDYNQLTTFRMVGETTSGEEFHGEQEILVTNRVSKKR